MGRSRLQARFGLIGLVSLVTLAAFVLGGLALMNLPGLPYNLQELVQTERPGVTLGTLGLALLITGMTPLYLARRWAHRPGEFAWVGPLNGFAVAVLVYSLLRVSVPLESIGDIVGAPVLKIAPEWENLGRFVGLYLGPLAGLTIGARLTIGASPGRRDAPGLLAVAAMAGLSYLVVVRWACTDNLVELLRDEGGWVSAFALLGFTAVLGATAGLVSRGAIRAAEGSWRPAAAAVALFMAALPLGWLLLVAATNPALTKYGQTFAAREFLFGPDRETHLGDQVLFLRYAIAEAVAVAALGAGMLIGRLVDRRETVARTASGSYPSPDRAESPAAPRAAHYAALSAAFAALAVYGSLVPLQYRHVPLAQAWEKFRQIPYLELGIESRSDWVANILLFIPLGFLSTGALRVDRPGRLRAFVAAAIVMSACTALSVSVEFVQIWFPQRTVSQNDVAAEILGAMAGIGLWSLAGRRLTRFCRDYAATLSPQRRVDLILQAYLAGMLLYSVLPLDLTISPADLWRKYRDGKIVLVGVGGGNMAGAAYLILAKTASFVPVGFLAVTMLPPRQTWIQDVRRSLLIGALLAAVIECAQLLVYSRTTNGADVLWGAYGAGIGASCWGTRRKGNDRQPERSRYEWSWLWPALTLGYAAALAVIFWLPFGFTTQKALVIARLHGLMSVPFSSLYRGSDWNAMTQIARKVLWFMPLGALMARGIMTHASDTTGHRLRIWIGLVACLAWASAIELGQVLLPAKIADLTDILLYETGAAIGLMLSVRLLELKGAVASPPQDRLS